MGDDFGELEGGVFDSQGAKVFGRVRELRGDEDDTSSGGSEVGEVSFVPQKADLSGRGIFEGCDALVGHAIIVFR